MNSIWYTVTRLFHPITLAVILVGVSGFLLGLIVAVERQDVAPPEIVAAAPRTDAGTDALKRIGRLESTLADRDAELVDLRAELARQRAVTPSSAELADAESRIAGLEAANIASSTEMKVLQGEITGLAGQLADAIQTRDELRLLNERLQTDNQAARQQIEDAQLDNQRARAVQEQEISDLRRESQAAQALASAQIEQARLDREQDRANFEQTISELRRELEVAQASRRDQLPVATVAREGEPPSPPAPPPAATPTPDASEPAAAVPSDEPQQANATATPPPNTPDTDAENQPPQSAALPPTAGPITRGVAAYQAEDYDKAYELWLPPALRGITRAQFFVGALYYEGRGVPANRVLAYLWLRVAASNDDPGAIKLLNQVRDGMTAAELAEAESRIARGETVPDR